MSKINELSNLPDISFIDGRSLTDIRDEMVKDYIDKLGELGEEASLPTAHPDRLIIYAAAAQIYQALQYIDRGAKQNFLKYSYGEFLENLAAFKKLTRNGAQRATTVLKFTLSALQSQTVAIPGGTRATTDDGIYFVTDEYCEVPPGGTDVTVTATAYESGTASNNVSVGAVKTIVDPIGYVAKVENTTISKGGNDVETDDEFTLRIYNAPPAYSVAGPAQAYIYWAKQARSDIGDVLVYSPDATEVTVVFILEDGSLPDDNDKAMMEAFLQNKEIRPLTDQVTAVAPTETNYNINLTYYISKSDEAQATAIQTAVGNAVNEYQTWQRKIGRDINPSELIYRIRLAGAKRSAVTAPSFTVVSDYNIPKAASVTVTYGGVEND